MVTLIEALEEVDTNPELLNAILDYLGGKYLNTLRNVYKCPY